MTFLRVLGVLIVLGYSGWLVVTPTGPGAGPTKIAPSVRSSPGGYRSATFWHSGEHGGK